MTPKKTFAMTIVLALVVALGLAVGVLPGAGLMSLRQIVSAQQVYGGNLVSIELDNDNNSMTPVPDTLELTAGERAWINALGTYDDGETEYLVQLLNGTATRMPIAQFRVTSQRSARARVPRVMTCFPIRLTFWSAHWC